MAELKKRPFCGHNAHFGQTIFNSKIVACNFCGSRTVGCYSDDLAAKFWNKRKVDEKRRALTIKELKMMVGQPVWVASNRKKEWCIVHSYHLQEVVGGGIIVTTRTSQKITLPFDKIGVTWRAYRSMDQEGC